LLQALQALKLKGQIQLRECDCLKGGSISTLPLPLLFENAAPIAEKNRSTEAEVDRHLRYWRAIKDSFF
jgi:hypothetical protein